MLLRYILQITHATEKYFFDSLQNYLHASCDVILLGDFNCVVDPHLDKSGGQDREDNSSRHFASICRDYL